MDIVLIDLNEELVKAWSEHFADCEDVEVLQGDYFSVQGDAIVSPANSYGIMDGGIDEILRRELGYETESKVQEAMEQFLEIGSAVSINLDHHDYDVLIAAPTMEEPGYVGDTSNAYSAFRAILKCASAERVERLVCCGLATGVGGMLPDECAFQMKKAYEEEA